MLFNKEKKWKICRSSHLKGYIECKLKAHFLLKVVHLNKRLFTKNKRNFVEMSIRKDGRLIQFKGRFA